MLGFITGKSKGVSTVPLFVLSLPILASRSFSLTSKVKRGNLNKKARCPSKKHWLLDPRLVKLLAQARWAFCARLRDNFGVISRLISNSPVGTHQVDGRWELGLHN